MNSSVTHDLLDQSNGIGCVSFIKEHHSVHLHFLIFLCLFFSLMNEFNDVTLFCTAMNLLNQLPTYKLELSRAHTPRAPSYSICSLFCTEIDL